MTIEIPGSITRAERALQVADFPLLPKDTDEKLVKVTRTNRCGHEGYLPKAVFMPTIYDVTNPRFAAHRVRDAWLRPQIRGTFEANLGPYAVRVGCNILPEMVYLAADTHKASVAITAGRVLVGPEVAHETVLAIWDDGHRYPDSDTLEQHFTRDWLVDLALPPGVGQPVPDYNSLAAPAYLTHEITKVFDGTMTVLSGDLRSDISYDGDGFQFSHSSTEGIDGNLVIARIPHLPSATL